MPEIKVNSIVMMLRLSTANFSFESDIVEILKIIKWKLNNTTQPERLQTQLQRGTQMEK